jgi:hypothetical protein
MDLQSWDYYLRWQKVGTLELRPLLFTGGYQGRPRNGRGLSGHAQLGAGISLSQFNKSPEIINLERQQGPTYPVGVVRTKNAPVAELSAGIDFFISRHVSFTSDFRMLLANVDADYSLACTGQCLCSGTAGKGCTLFPAMAPIGNRFSASTGQVLVGIRFWLW